MGCFASKPAELVDERPTAEATTPKPAVEEQPTKASINGTDVNKVSQTLRLLALLPAKVREDA
jgi:hypothetical protein